MKQEYTYSVIRYVHDRGAGETLNVGVMLFAPASKFLNVMVELRYESLPGHLRSVQWRAVSHRNETAWVAVEALREPWNTDTSR